MTRLERRVVLVSILALAGGAARAEEPARLAEVDRTRLAEAFRLADRLGNKVWPGWDRAPFAVLLVTPEREFLLRHPKPSDDFTDLGEDALLGGKVWSRPRQFEPRLLATFPAVGGVPTIVIGQAERTDAKTSTRWVITLLHEHFHQLQMSQPRYNADVAALGLARGDQSGMWMLNYPFPYDRPAVKSGFAALCRALAAALAARSRPEFPERLAAYAGERRKFIAALAGDDWKYFGFQLWQEGVARYTESRLADLAAGDYEPGAAFAALKDFRSYQSIAQEIRARIEKDLGSLEIDRAKRTVVYSFGAAEGLLLDAARPGWQKRYFDERFSLDGHFPQKK